jgi:predicted transcriptional regulator
MIQETSLLAYTDIEERGDIETRQKKVIEALRVYGWMSNMRLSKMLGWPINCITPRVKELREMNLVEEKCKQRCEYTGRLVIVWGLR